MALERDDDDQPGDELTPPPGRDMSPARLKDRAAVLAAMEEGDLALDKVERVKKPKAAKVDHSVDAKPKAKREPVADPDDPAFDDIDEDEELAEGLVEGTEDAPKPKPRKKAAAKPAADDDDDDETGTPFDEDDDDDAPPDEDDEDDEEPGDDADVNEKLAAQEKRSLARIADAERRSKERTRSDRVALERDKAAFLREWEPQVALARETKSIYDRAKVNPIGAVMDFATRIAKIEGDDWELMAKAHFAQSPRAQADPKSRESGVRAMREAESRSELEQVKQQNAALLQRMEQREQLEAAQAETKTYLRSVAELVDGSTPLVRRMIRKNPDAVRPGGRLHRLATEMAQETGQAPSPAKLLRRMEKLRRGELLELGVDPASIFKKKAPANGAETKTTTKAGKQKAKATKTANGAVPSRRALRDDVERALRDGELQ